MCMRAHERVHDIHVQQAFELTSNSCHIHSFVYTLTHIQNFHSSTVVRKHPRETRTLTEAMKARQKCWLAGPTTGFWANKAPCIEENSELGRILSCMLIKAKNKYTHTHIHTHKFARLYE